MVESEFCGLLEPWQWWRAGGYEVLGGTHLVPKPGSGFEPYDPFRPKERIGPGHKRLAWEAPYVEFLRVDFRVHREAVAWANRWGLLGILPQQTVEAALWPRWDYTRSEDGGPGFRPLRAHQEQYRVDLGTNTVRWDFSSAPMGAEPGQPLSAEETEYLAGRDPVLSRNQRRPGVLRQDQWDGHMEWVDLLDGLVLFFPKTDGVPELTARMARRTGDSFDGPLPEISDRKSLEQELRQKDYPFPFSEPFLSGYGEPLFLLEIFQRYLEHIKEEIEYKGSDEGAADFDSSLPALEIALLGVNPVAVPVQPWDKLGIRWEQGWKIRSLYAGMAQMMVRDILFKGRHLRNCKVCNKLFLAKHPMAEYCSPTHRKTYQMREFRRSKAEE